MNDATPATGATAYVHGAAGTDKPNRDRDDFTPTPPEGTQRLLAVETFEGSIWEPACGAGDISKVLEAAGYTVLSTDLIDRGYGQGGIDFLLDYQTTADNIVTNPPYKFDDEFVWHALNRSTRKVAMLLRLGWIAGHKRKKFIESTPLARVWVFSGRLQMQRGRLPAKGDGKTMVDSAWLVWDKSHKGPPQIGLI